MHPAQPAALLPGILEDPGTKVHEENRIGLADRVGKLPRISSPDEADSSVFWRGPGDVLVRLVKNGDRERLFSTVIPGATLARRRIGSVTILPDERRFRG